jgi:hypothetical protein
MRLTLGAVVVPAVLFLRIQTPYDIAAMQARWRAARATLGFYSY